jgi:hypothetical protein
VYNRTSAVPSRAASVAIRGSGELAARARRCRRAPARPPFGLRRVLTEQLSRLRRFQGVAAAN